MTASSSHIKNIAIVGAAGRLGQELIKSLLAEETRAFHITVITRSDSTSTSSLLSDPRIAFQRGSYEDPEFLAAALKGQDALIIALGFAAPPSLHTGFIKAAAEAQVPFVVPAEFGSDNSRQQLVESVAPLGLRVQWREEIERLGVSSWIAIVTNPWLDMGNDFGPFSIDVKNKKAVIYNDGNARANTTLLATAGLAAARVLSLPISAPAGEPSLENYRNRAVYVRSLSVTQNEMLEAVQRVTGTDGWDVSHRNLDDLFSEGKEQVAAGNFLGYVTILYASTFVPGLGADYSGPLANDALGLPEEDLDKTVKRVERSIEAA